VQQSLPPQQLKGPSVNGHTNCPQAVPMVPLSSSQAFLIDVQTIVNAPGDTL
jgi:hypothetical protein